MQTTSKVQSIAGSVFGGDLKGKGRREVGSILRNETGCKGSCGEE